MKFSELGLAEPFLRATDALGYETATPIQARAIPVVLGCRDLIGCAQTGTGKTAAFTLPMLDRLMQTLPPKPSQPASGHTPTSNHTPTSKSRRRGPKGATPKPRPIRALVLSPTRELAAQIGESLTKYGRYTPLRQTVVFGGVSQHHQVKALRHGVDALVATPGRLLDLMDQGYIDLARVEVLVFDEADQMLDMGFLPALKRIVASVPKKRQTLMFSATMPDEIRRLAQQWLNEPESIEVAPVSTPAERIAQSVHLVDKKKKADLLSRFLRETPRGRTLVFSRTKHGADKIVKRLTKDGVKASAIHGNKSQGARNRALAQFKSKNPPVLIATDIAARGLDINGVSHVVNYDLPETPETYVHRIGRTARAGAEGVAVSFCAGDEHGLLRQIERLTKRKLPVEPTLAGFEPTDKVSHAPPSRGGGQRGGNAGGGRQQRGARAKRPTTGRGESTGRPARPGAPARASGETRSEETRPAMGKKKRSQRPGKAERAKRAAAAKSHSGATGETKTGDAKAKRAGRPGSISDEDMKRAVVAAAARKRRKRHSRSL
ncbi:MAG: DEAD/DEAH box helicase [Planctomycetota bacterium]